MKSAPRAPIKRRRKNRDYEADVTMIRKIAFQAGDRIAYAAKFLRDTGQQVGCAGERRGTFLAPAVGWPAHARVKWDDIEATIATGLGQYGDPEFVSDVRERGSIVSLCAIAKVGSSRFACNDL